MFCNSLAVDISKIGKSLTLKIRDLRLTLKDVEMIGHIIYLLSDFFCKSGFSPNQLLMTTGE